MYEVGEDEEYIQIAKYDIITSTETELTSWDYDHEKPSPSHNGSHVAYQVLDGDGVYQIGKVGSGGGDEQNLTTSPQDLTEPDWSQDNTSIYCIMCHGLTDALGLVDAEVGGYTPITDSSAIRDNPDTWYDDIGTNYNYVVYEREDTSSGGSFGQEPPRRHKKGTGIFLIRAIRAKGKEGGQTVALRTLALHRAVPNPAAGPVTIRYQVPKLCQVSLKAYDISGRCVCAFVDGEVKPGEYELVWHGQDNEGRRLASGVYFYALETDEKKLTRKVVLARPD